MTVWLQWLSGRRKNATSCMRTLPGRMKLLGQVLEYTVKSRYNGSQGTNKFHALLPDFVIAIMTILYYLLCCHLC